jgi:ABC-type histidine transport system ATPase subunit
MTGIADARGVRRSLQRLTDLGELVWVRGSNNSGKSNVYFITFIEQPVAKMTPVNDQNDLSTSDQNDPLLNKRLDKLLNAEKIVFDSKFQSAFMLQAVDRVAGALAPLQVVELIESFADSYECKSAYTDDVRLTRFWSLLDSAASQAKGEM